MQWHLIARVDDMMKLRVKDITANLEHPESICVQMRWSKNITEERESPRQIVLGSLDERMCVLLNLAVFIELLNDPCGGDEFLFGNGVDGDRGIRTSLNDVLGSIVLPSLSSGNLGTHSMRKGPATYCARLGQPKDDIESRGRWRSDKRQVDTYMDIQRPYPDARIAACLCGPSGPVKYKLSGDFPWLTREFLSSRIAPKIARLLGHDVAATLGLPLLWAAIQKASTYNSDVPILPIGLSDRVCDAVYEVAGQISANLNPVVRCPIVVVGHGGSVNLVEMQTDRESSELHNAGADAGEMFRQIAAIHSTIIAMKQRMEEINSIQQREIADLRSSHQTTFNRLHQTMRRVVQRPIGIVRPTTAAQGDVVRPVDSMEPIAIVHAPPPRPPARLAARPKNLHDLYHEYQFGLGGSKPAKLFSSAERGSCRFTYSLRLGFWTLVDSLVRKGHTSETAIDSIYGAYGVGEPVVSILRSIRADKKRGGHPSLR
jgi:hypothetical protein